MNCKDGSTLSFELSKDEEYQRWVELTSRADFMQQVTGLSILYNTYWHTLPLPKRFRNINFHAKVLKSDKGGIERIIGERIVCQADEIQISVITYYGNRPKMTRIDVRKIGKQRFSPKEISDGSHEEECL